MDAERRRILRSFPGEVGDAEVFALLDAMDERDRLAARVAALEGAGREVADALDYALGDTDPCFEEGVHDDIIRSEAPVFWACRRISAALTREDPS